MERLGCSQSLTASVGGAGRPYGRRSPCWCLYIEKAERKKRKKERCTEGYDLCFFYIFSVAVIKNICMLKIINQK
jgi:hypothetical protein